jgi:hypothetical protein
MLVVGRIVGMSVGVPGLVVEVVGLRVVGLRVVGSVVVEATDGATVGSVRWLTAKNDRDTAAGAVVSAAAGATDGIALGSLWV